MRIYLHYSMIMRLVNRSYLSLSGQYDDYITVVIYSIAGNDIYYTTDGTVPDKENGIPYPQGGIPLNHTGNFEINAVCCNEKASTVIS